jgi:hypothetical protein
MGTDNLHSKRKARTTSDLNRRKPAREAYAKILIVCEGEKTEPYYFQEIIDYYEIHTAKIRADCGTDPVSVVQHGFNLYEEEINAKEGSFDRVYCVFDKDNPAKYKTALSMINGTKQKGVFFAANSVPSFEYWLLLHFVFTTAPFSAVGGVSSGAAALKALKQHMPQYTKASQDTFAALLGKLEDAKDRASRANTSAIAANTDNPSTYVHELVDFLQHVKPKLEGVKT